MGNDENAPVPRTHFRLTYRPALDGLRGIAILSVIAAHAQIPYLGGGFIGVDIFFVLSGFLITALLLQEAEETGAISLRQFYIRRSLRLFPALAVLLGAVVLFPHVFGMPRGQAATVASVAVLYVSNWARAFDLIDLEVLSHAWSLAVEEQFYLLWPPVVALCVALGIRRKWLMLIAVAGIAEAVIMRVVLWNGEEAWRRVYFGLDTRIDGLLIGALTALVLASLPNLDVFRRRACRVVVVVAALALGAALHYGQPTAAPMYFGIGSLVSLCVAVVLLGTLTAQSRMASLLAFGPLVWIGRISYGLYLWHYPVIEGVFEEHRMMRLGVDTALLIPIQITASLAIAAGSFYLLEQPLLRLKRRFGSRMSGPPVGAGARRHEHRLGRLTRRLRYVQGSIFRSRRRHPHDVRARGHQP